MAREGLQDKTTREGELFLNVREPVNNWGLAVHASFVVLENLIFEPADNRQPGPGAVTAGGALGAGLAGWLALLCRQRLELAQVQTWWTTLLPTTRPRPPKEGSP